MDTEARLGQADRMGDQAAFAALVGKYKRAVFGVILPKVRNFHQAENVTQAFGPTGIRRFSTPIAPSSAWSHTVTWRPQPHRHQKGFSIRMLKG